MADITLRRDEQYVIALMQIIIQHKNVQSVDALDRWVEQRLFTLADRIPVERAQVRLERQWASAPPYRAAIRIATRGPAVEAVGTDKTLQAAVAKALRSLERKARRQEKRKP